MLRSRRPCMLGCDSLSFLAVEESARDKHLLISTMGKSRQTKCRAANLKSRSWVQRCGFIGACAAKPPRTYTLVRDAAVATRHGECVEIRRVGWMATPSRTNNTWSSWRHKVGGFLHKSWCDASEDCCRETPKEGCWDMHFGHLGWQLCSWFLLHRCALYSCILSSKASLALFVWGLIDVVLTKNSMCLTCRCLWILWLLGPEKHKHKFAGRHFLIAAHTGIANAFIDLSTHVSRRPCLYPKHRNQHAFRC